MVVSAILIFSGGRVAVAQSSDESPASERKLEKARAADPAWKPKYKEQKVNKVATKGGAVNNYCLNQGGQLLVCVGQDDEKTKGPTELQIISPEGKVLKQVPLKMNPQAICTDNQGNIYVVVSDRDPMDEGDLRRC